jgi:hypothetical protein
MKIWDAFTAQCKAGDAIFASRRQFTVRLTGFPPPLPAMGQVRRQKRKRKVGSSGTTISVRSRTASERVVSWAPRFLLLFDNMVNYTAGGLKL